MMHFILSYPWWMGGPLHAHPYSSDQLCRFCITQYRACGLLYSMIFIRDTASFHCDSMNHESQFIESQWKHAVYRMKMSAVRESASSVLPLWLLQVKSTYEGTLTLLWQELLTLIVSLKVLPTCSSCSSTALYETYVANQEESGCAHITLSSWYLNKDLNEPRKFTTFKA